MTHLTVLSEDGFTCPRVAMDAGGSTILGDVSPEHRGEIRVAARPDRRKRVGLGCHYGRRRATRRARRRRRPSTTREEHHEKYAGAEDSPKRHPEYPLSAPSTPTLTELCLDIRGSVGRRRAPPPEDDRG